MSKQPRSREPQSRKARRRQYSYVVILEKIVLSLSTAPERTLLRPVQGKLSDGRRWSGVRSAMRTLDLELHIGILS